MSDSESTNTSNQPANHTTATGNKSPGADSVWKTPTKSTDSPPSSPHYERTFPAMEAGPIGPKLPAGRPFIFELNERAKERNAALKRARDSPGTKGMPTKASRKDRGPRSLNNKSSPTKLFQPQDTVETQNKTTPSAPIPKAAPPAPLPAGEQDVFGGSQEIQPPASQLEANGSQIAEEIGGLITTSRNQPPSPATTLSALNIDEGTDDQMAVDPTVDGPSSAQPQTTDDHDDIYASEEEGETRQAQEQVDPTERERRARYEDRRAYIAAMPKPRVPEHRPLTALDIMSGYTADGEIIDPADIERLTHNRGASLAREAEEQWMEKYGPNSPDPAEVWQAHLDDHQPPSPSPLPSRPPTRSSHRETTRNLNNPSRDPPPHLPAQLRFNKYKSASAAGPPPFPSQTSPPAPPPPPPPPPPAATWDDGANRLPDDLVAAPIPPGGYPRVEGLYTSDIIRCINQNTCEFWYPKEPPSDADRRVVMTPINIDRRTDMADFANKATTVLRSITGNPEATAAKGTYTTSARLSPVMIFELTRDQARNLVDRRMYISPSMSATFHPYLLPVPHYIGAFTGININTAAELTKVHDKYREKLKDPKGYIATNIPSLRDRADPTWSNDQVVDAIASTLRLAPLTVSHGRGPTSAETNLLRVYLNIPTSKVTHHHNLVLALQNKGIHVIQGSGEKYRFNLYCSICSGVDHQQSSCELPHTPGWPARTTTDSTSHALDDPFASMPTARHEHHPSTSRPPFMGNRGRGSGRFNTFRGRGRGSGRGFFGERHEWM